MGTQLLGLCPILKRKTNGNLELLFAFVILHYGIGGVIILFRFYVKSMIIVSGSIGSWTIDSTTV